ncbi:ABC transporter permease [Mucilaginibacter auburnensis]|uniref:Putative ABC transport system permease protein n=1 Tax=Mucilaginibacter auburnensis TaxID=1457233 RepID=A0A2H9VLN4_9SPHI|nr:ABC transporter permease [Mucilaginibacter auburnensis]PJJ79231.1 putative ABC transport system permease protein [Mucilaginibacter auburnensis]
MIKNYLKIAWRSLLKQRLYSVIIISGLAVGLAACITIGLYVAHEHSYDRFHKDADRIFTAHQVSYLGQTRIDWIKYNSGENIKRTQPKVEDCIGIHKHLKKVIVSQASAPTNKIAEDDLIYTSKDFFKFFSFRLLNGDVSNVLSEPFSLVLTQAMAKKYFGDSDPIGKTLLIATDSTYTYKVTGIVENNPSNSTINFNFIASDLSMLKMREYGNFKTTGTTFVKLRNALDTGAVVRSMQASFKKDENIKFSLVPFVNTHLEGVFGTQVKGNFLEIFPLVAALILLLALVNYMSLATAKATLRAKEIGVRKVAGASRTTVAIQFFIESALFTVLSFALAFLLFYLFKPWFLNVLQIKIDNSFLYNHVVLMLLAALLVGTIVLAGSYPALVLSSFNPASTLKGKMAKNTGGVTVRKIFTTLQFTVAIALIICGITIDRQLYFFRHTYTGLDRENILVIPGSPSFGKNYQSFNQDIKTMVGDSMVAASRRNIFDSGYNILILNDQKTEEESFVTNFEVNRNFFNLLKINWKTPPPSLLNIGETDILINEQAITKLHLKPDPIGQKISSGNKMFNPNGMTYTVAGIVKNFNYMSLASEIQPVAVLVKPDTASTWNRGFNMYVKIKPHTNIPGFVSSIKHIYEKYDAETPFSYSFLDDDFNAQYKAEDRLASIFSLFTYIAIILATLGLFGLAAFSIEQRVKEIGIRKVLGASTTSINTLLSIDFLKLVILSVVIASPIAWWAMHGWLQNFSYRITIPWWVFILSAFIAICTAFITVSYNSIKAALANPVKSLRSE